jgi:pantetheine-phosphate adenylyltransferase
MFTLAERVDLAAASTAQVAGVRCVAHDGLTVDAARRYGADVLVRVAHKDLGGERAMAAVNGAVADIRTFVIAPDAAYRHLSSTVVRELAGAGRLDAVAGMVPAPVAAALARRTPAS